ncbi:hypothetical protein ACQP2X_02905 [Actinoplanes sp. CA-131856]
MSFVLHLKLDVDDAARAAQLSRHFLRLMHGVFPEIDTASSLVVEDGEQPSQAFLFCGRALPRGEHCMQPTDHGGGHSPEWTVR